MTTCPYCGCQIYSPFPWQHGLVIHDLDECRTRDEREKLSLAGDMVKGLTQCEEAGSAIEGDCGSGEISKDPLSAWVHGELEVDDEINRRRMGRHFGDEHADA